jgi:hypothetical protein
MPLIWPCACRFKNDTLIEDTECGYHAAMRKRCGEADGVSVPRELFARILEAHQDASVALVDVHGDPHRAIVREMLALL